MFEVRRLTADEAQERIRDLAAVLTDCVDGGASVSFMAPFAVAEAENYFRKLLPELAAGDRILLGAFEGTDLLGTVQIVTYMPPNQPHRADIAKLLVSRRARRKGIGQLLMQHGEEQARRAGKTLLVLDTATGGDAERLYERLGWVKVGEIPGYALLPDGVLCATSIFWKTLTPNAEITP
jgi:ribosomal protein S18 acetylase RimI-like enzyme